MADTATQAGHLDSPVPSTTRRRRRRWLAGGALVLAAAALLPIGLQPGDPPEQPVEQVLREAVADHDAGRLAEAVEGYEEVLERQPGNKIASYNLGLMAHRDGDLEEAAERYRDALRSDPSYVPALLNLAVLRLDEGDPAGAAELYRLAVAAEPDNADAHLRLGEALVAMGEVEEGRASIARALRLDPAVADTAE